MSTQVVEISDGSIVVTTDVGLNGATKQALADEATARANADGALTAAIAAAKADCVLLTGNQSVAGTKTFSSGPLVPTAATGTTTTQAASTAFVQQELGAGVASARALVILVRNQSGSTMTAGTVVYINGATGNLSTIARALGTGDATSAQTIGLVQTSIANNGTGSVVIRGVVSGLDTQALTEGQQLYLSSTVAGGYTTTKQYAPNHLVYVGIVTRSHPTHGSIEVAIQNGYELDEIHDVSAQNPTNGDTLRFNSATGLWEKSALGTAAVLNAGTAAGNLTVLDANGKVSIGQIPTTDIQIIFRKGTDAERQTVVFAEGEGIYTTDKKEFWIGDGVTLGGVRPSPSYLLNTGSNGIAGSNLGGSGTPGAAGTTVTPIVYIDGGNGGANAASGTGNGGAASTMATPVLLKITGGNGGAANGNNAGGAAGAFLGANLIQITGSSGGSASTGSAGRSGSEVMTAGALLRVLGGPSGAGSTGTGIGGAASTILLGSSSALVRLQGGAGGNANGDFSGGNGGQVFPSTNHAAINIIGGLGGAAGVGGDGGHCGVVGTLWGLIRFVGGGGGAGGSGAPGGAGGAINVPALRVESGMGGAGGAAGETGGAGGVAGGITLNGGAGATGTGGSAGGAGGAGGSLTLNGGAASGTTPGGAGGVINLSAIGTTPGAKILFGTAAPESSVTAPPGSLYLRNNAGAGEMWLKTSGTGNTGWAIK